MVCGVEMVSDGEITLAVTVEGFIARRCDDPIIPADVAEVNIERPSLTDVATVFPTVTLAAAWRTSRTCRVSNRTLLVASVVGVGEEKWLSLRPVLGTIIYASF